MIKEEKTLTELYSLHKGKISDRWTRYLAEYDLFFQELRGKAVRMLEIGVQNGGGLEIWAEYFRRGRLFIGCDINPDCASLRFEDPRIKLVIGDANTDPIQKEILSHSPDLDIVIDDGSHYSGDVIRSFTRYFPNLVDGGIYVTEDLHTSYWAEYGGGLFAPLSSISFFKRLVDMVNSEHWGIERDRSEILKGFQEKYGVEIGTEILHNIHSIQFVNSLCIIQKSPMPNNRLGTRFVAGSTAAVCGEMEQFHGNLLVPPSQISNPWSVRVRPPDEELPEIEEQVHTLKQQVQTLKQQVQTLNENIFGLREKVNEAEQEVQSLNVELGEIYRSRGWKFIQNLWRFRLWLVPHGSARERMVSLLYRPIRYWHAKGFKRLLKRVVEKKLPSSDPENAGRYRVGTPLIGNSRETTYHKTDNIDTGLRSYISPLPIFITPYSHSRLNILIGKFDSGQPFGRTAIGIIFSSLLAERWDCDIRLITYSESTNKQHFGDILHANNIPCTRNIEFIGVNQDNSRIQLPVGPGDIFLTTSWQTTANLLEVFDERRVMFLLQEDERIGHIESDQHGLCQKVYWNEKIKFIVNTKRLYEHLISTGIENIRTSGVFFEAAWPETLFFAEGGRLDGRKNFFFINSSDSDDLLFMGFEAMEAATQKRIFNRDEWNFFSVGKFRQKTRNAQSFLLKHYQDIDWADYLSLVRKTDLGLVITGTPFLPPDYHPFDLVASGAVVVTNFLEDAQDLIAYPENVIRCGAQVDEIIQSLARGVELVNQADLRVSNFHGNMLSKDWRLSFTDVISSIEKWGFNVSR